MPCCSQCRGIEEEFGERLARRELRRYRQRGPRKTTRMLLDALRLAGVNDATVLDVGGGIGTIHHELLDAGAQSAVHVDAASSYVEVAREEAMRRGHADRVEFRYGDFVAVSPSVPTADVVTLDRVICCYHDMHALVTASASHARRLYGLVYPRDHLLVRLGGPLINVLMRLRKSQFRAFVHPTAEVDAAVRAAGLTPRWRGTTLIWQVVVYGR